MKEAIRQATKAQAKSIRDYLSTLGVTLTHTQALEVIARGQGHRSRHLLAAELDRTPETAQSVEDWVDANFTGPRGVLRAMKHHVAGIEAASSPLANVPRTFFTVVSYRYVDGSNCKRYGQTVFRGRFKPEQLRFIQSKLDADEFFVPAQVGFENLAFAFTDFGSEDHGWHILEMGDSHNWTLDAEGYVLEAGDVRQVTSAHVGEFATDADCDNCFFRFAMIDSWDEELQLGLLANRAYEPQEVDTEDENAPADSSVARLWRVVPTTERCSVEALESLCSTLRMLEFQPVEHVRDMLEWSREVGPNAHQFIQLKSCEAEQGDLVLRFGIRSEAGNELGTRQEVAYRSNAESQLVLSKVRQALDTQLNSARVLPSAWDSDFE